MALSVATVITQTRNLLADNQNFVTSIPGQLSPGSWSPDQFLDAVNFAVKDYLRKKKLSYTVVRCPSLSGSTGTVPYDYVMVPGPDIGVERVYWQSSGTATENGVMLYASDRQSEEWRDPNWETQTALAPNRWIPWAGSQIRLAPIAMSSGSPPLNCSIGYLEAPGVITEYTDVVVDGIVAGNTYSIVSVGTPSSAWTTVGAPSATVGTIFRATGTSTGTGMAIPMIDNRVEEAQQEYIKYAAAYYLLVMRGDRFEVELAERYMMTFNQLIGVL